MVRALSAEQLHRSLAGFLGKAFPALLYGVRLAAAVSLSLFVAFYLQLDTPSWAGTSAAIVCQPIVGSSLRKGLFRMIGTVIGAVAAVALTALFPQERVEFLLGLLLWLSLCSFVATLLRNFAAYAAMLAGYTLAIIASTSIAAPDQVFEIAIGRASEICIGIVCGTLVVGLTDLGDAPRRLAGLLSGLIAETIGHLVTVLETAGGRGDDGPDLRRALLARVAALDPIIDQAVGESPEVLHRRSLLQSAVNGFIGALTGIRTVETHLRSLPPAEARRTADFLLAHLPHSWRAGALPEADRDRTVVLARALVGVPTDDPALRLAADGVAEAALGLAAAANGLALLIDPARAMDIRRSPALFVADYLPACLNALRVFLGVGAVILFWIVTAWPGGLLAVTFAAVTIMVFSPMEDRSGSAALGQGIGTALAAIAAAAIKFGLLPGHDTFPAFAAILSLALIPFGALSTVPMVAPYFIPGALNLVPLLAPTNHMVFDISAYINNAMGLLAGCIAGGMALILFPHLPRALQSRRLVDLSIRDLRRLAAGHRRWTLGQWQNRIHARMIAMPDGGEPLQRSHLVATLSVGLQLIRLERLARHGRAGAEIAEIRALLAAGDLAALRAVLERVDREIAAIPRTLPGGRGRLRARAALLAILQAVNRRSEYFRGSSA